MVSQPDCVLLYWTMKTKPAQSLPIPLGTVLKPGSLKVLDNRVYLVDADGRSLLHIAPRAKVDALMAAAQAKIDAKDSDVYDIASENGQMFGNVYRMTWFRKAVARHLTETTVKYSALNMLFAD